MAALQILLYFIWLYFLIKIVREHVFFRSSGISPNELTAFFVLKVLAGIALTLLYTYYYTDKSKSDIWRYFTDSVIISKLFFSHPKIWLHVISGWGISEPEVFRYLLNTQNFSHPESDFVTSNAFIIRAVSVLNILTAHSIYTNTLIFNFLSFVGFTALYRAFSTFFKKYNRMLLAPFFLLPSVFFWSSGLLKDAFVFCSIGMMFYCWVHTSLPAAKRIAYLLFFASVLLLTKLQVLLIAAALLPILPTPFIRINNKWIIAMIISYSVALFALREHIVSLLCNRRNQFIELGMQEQAGSLFSINPCDSANTLLLMIHGFVDGLLQPFLWNTATYMNTLAGIENWLILGISLAVWIRYASAKHINYRLAVFCFTFCVVNLTIIGTTVPIAGALVHYRTISIPFLVVGMLSIVNLEKFKYDINRLSTLVFSTKS